MVNIEVLWKINESQWAAPTFAIPKKLLPNEKVPQIKIGVLWKINESQWAAPTFAIPKKLLPNEKVPQVKIVSNF